jgi:hypothetical protein
MTRIRMRSVGHPDSRFRDLTIPLCDPQGAPVDSLLWLANGGGKTSLLSLLFALVLPLRRDFMGAEDQERALEEYVQKGDTSHVVVEWADVDAGGLPGLETTVPRLVTGMVHEWSGRVAPADRAADKNKLASLYYAFTAVPGSLTLDGLPFLDDDGTPRTLKDYTEALREGSRRGGASDLELFQGKRVAWAEYLEESLRIDPGLYRYQVRMNAAEGAVAKLFRFRSSREFVEFLIEFTAGQGGSSGRSLDTTTDNVRTLLGKLAAKPRLAVEQRFAAAAAERLTELHEAGEEHVTAIERRRSSQERSATVSASLVAAAEALERDERLTRENTDGVADRLRRAIADRQAVAARAAQFDLEDARLAAADARTAHGTARTAAAEAKRLDTAWRAVPTLADLAGLDGEITALRAQVTAETESARPLRHTHDAAALALRDALDTAAHTGEVRATELAAETAKHQSDLDDATAAGAEAQRAAAKAEEAAAQRREQARAATARAATEVGGDDVRAWREDAVPASRGQVSAAIADAAEDERRARADVDEVEAEATVARDRLRELAERLETLNDDLRTADAAARAAAETHREASDALAALGAEGRVRDLAEAAEDDPLDLHALGEALHARLADASQAALADFAEHTAAAGAHEAVLAAVGATGYAPAAGDTVEALRALHAAGVRARAGWEVLRELAPDRATLMRALRVDDVAVLAAGVVVEPADLARVRDLLAGDDLTTAAVVAVVDRPAVAAALARAGDPAGEAGGPRLRIPADPALYDRRAAGDAQARHERHARDARDQAGASRTAAEADRALAARLRALLDRYPAHELLRLQTEKKRTAAEQHQAQRLVDAAGDDRRMLTARLDELEPLARACEEDVRGAKAAHDALQRAATLLDDASGLEAAAAAADREAADARGRANRRAADAEALRADVAQLEARHRDALADVRTLREERERVQVLEPGEAHAADEPAGGGAALDRLRTAYEGLHREWESQTSASQAARLLEEAERRRKRLRERLPDDDALVAAARDLLAGPDGATPAAQTAAAERAHDDALTAEHDLAAAEVELQRAEQLVTERRPRDKESHAPLEAKPATRSEAQAGAAEARERLAVLDRSVAELTAEHDGLQRRASRVASAAEALRHKARELDAGRHAAEAAEAADGIVQAPVDDVLVGEYLGIDGGGRAHEEASIARGRGHADADVAEALAEERALGEAVAAAAGQVSAASTALRRLGATAEFKDVPDTIRDRVLADDTATLLETAPTLAADLRQRASLIGQQLDDLAVDTDLVVSRLVTAVRDVLADLAKAERYARMPAGTGTWSERSFLTIRTGPQPDAATIAGRLRPVLERFAASPDTLVPMSLLKECVLAGAGGPQAFRVKVLKPNAPGQEPEDITKLQKFSGGEKLTVCVALYCVLAKLRAHNAGQDGGGGTLVLDNPLGTASHTRLLSLQRKVAAAHGVQLVYATGVNDLGAVGEFAHRIRLRKTWHAAVGRSYVDAEEEPGITAAHIGQREA